jgi:Uri superfamily endonuclease
MPDYTNGKIYRIDVGNMYYIGSTTLSLQQRMRCHKQDIHRTSYFYEKVREHGIQNCIISLLEDVPCECNAELIAKEQVHLDSVAGDPMCLNKRRAVKC